MNEIKLTAARLLARGFPVIPINQGKRCTMKGWKKRLYSVQDFKPGYNIGLRVGGSYVDVDLDCLEVKQLAPYMLPETATYGHSGNITHAFYKLSNPEACTGRIDLAGFGRKGYGLGLDLRCTEHGEVAKFYSMMPPSIHPDTNEQLVWSTRPEELSVISWQELKSKFFVLAVAADFLRLYRKLDGLHGHHEFCLQVAGAMRSCEWPQELASEVFAAVLSVAQEPDPDDRMGCLRTSYESDTPTGIPTLSDTLIRLEPLSRFLDLLRHDGLPIQRTVPTGAKPAERKSIAASLLDSEMSSLEDYDLAMLLHKGITTELDNLVRYKGNWYERKANNDWALLCDKPLQAVIKVSEMLKSAADAAPNDLRAEYLKKSAYCRSVRGMGNVLKAAEPFFERGPIQLPANHLLTKNAIVDLTTGEHRPWSGEFTLDKPLPIMYDPSAECPLWSRVISGCMMNIPERIEALQTSLGMSLGDQGKDEIMSIWLGPKAGNGKSTITRVLSEILGSPCLTKVPLETLTGNQFRTTSNLQLRGSRIAHVSEVKTTFNAGTIKELTGGDSVSAYALAQGQEEFRSTWTVHLMANEMPLFNRFDEGIARRLFVVLWDAQFDDDTRDKTLDERLPKEASGIFNWLVRGHLMWRERGKNLKMDAQSQSMVLEYTDEMDEYKEFAETYLIFEPDARVCKAKVFEKWKEYCYEQDIKYGGTQKRFTRTLRQKFDGITNEQSGRVYLYGGVRLRTKADD